MLCGWEVNRRSGIILAMYLRLSGLYNYGGAQQPQKGRWAPRLHPSQAMAPLPLPILIFYLVTLFSFCWKILFEKYKSWDWKLLTLGELRGRSELFSTYNSLSCKFAAVCWKITTCCSVLFFNSQNGADYCYINIAAVTAERKDILAE